MLLTPGWSGGWFPLPVAGSVGRKGGSTFKEAFKLQLRAFGCGSRPGLSSLEGAGAADISALSSCDHLRAQDFIQDTAQPLLTKEEELQPAGSGPLQLQNPVPSPESLRLPRSLFDLEPLSHPQWASSSYLTLHLTNGQSLQLCLPNRPGGAGAHELLKLFQSSMVWQVGAATPGAKPTTWGALLPSLHTQRGWKDLEVRVVSLLAEMLRVHPSPHSPLLPGHTTHLHFPPPLLSAMPMGWSSGQ